MNINLFLNRKTTLHCADGYHFTGTVEAVKDDGVLFLDKFGKRILISVDTITRIEDEGGGND